MKRSHSRQRHEDLRDGRIHDRVAGFDKNAVASLLGRRGHIALEVHSNGSGDALGKDRWAPGAVCRWRNIFIKSLSP